MHTTMKTTFLTLALLCVLLPSAARAEELNAGFVQGLWYSSPTLFAGEPARIYVALRNHTDQDLTGAVKFTDNGKRIGVTNVSALPGRLVEAWIDWTPGYGEHAIVATLSEVRMHTIGETPEAGEVESMLAEDTIMIDYDTDKDGVGNIADTDDDNDSISDTDEAAQGSDPLIANIQKKEVVQTAEKETVRATEESPTRATLASSSTMEGLERFTHDGGTIDNLLSNVTEKVTSAKTSLDTYRASRTDTAAQYFAKSTTTSSSSLSDAKGAVLSSSPQALATITRSKIESGNAGFLGAVWDGGKAIVGGFFTFALFLLSTLLANTMLIQVALLLGIVFLVYRTARKFGRRPGR